MGKLDERFKLRNYNFDLPRELIRQTPPANRSDCRLMTLKGREINHSTFASVSGELSKGDVLILNKTKVRKSLVYGRKSTGGKLEINFIEKDEEGFTVLIKGRVRDGETIELDDRRVRVGSGTDNFRRVYGNIDWKFIDTVGHLPLPPYVKVKQDFDYYQNELGSVENSIAAPTASLHFGKEMIERLKRKGVRILYVLLGVGYGTFKEIRDDCIRMHVVDEEDIEVGEDVVSEAESAKGKVVAIGTTVMRALETASYPGRIVPYTGKTRIYIYPGWKFNSPVTDLITNFHIPRSSLLSLVYAFGGEERLKEAYRLAIEKRYYFYSLGDAMMMDKFP